MSRDMTPADAIRMIGRGDAYSATTFRLALRGCGLGHPMTRAFDRAASRCHAEGLGALMDDRIYRGSVSPGAIRARAEQMARDLEAGQRLRETVQSDLVLSFGRPTAVVESRTKVVPA